MARYTHCEVCGLNLSNSIDRCTNGRCHDCHNAHCTPGGSTSPGHGRGTVPAPFANLRIVWCTECEEEHSASEPDCPIVAGLVR